MNFVHSTVVMTMLLAACVAISAPLGAQDTRLAQQYFQDGEYEKAAELYDRLYQQNNSNSFFFERYIESLIELERFEEGETALKKQLRKEPDNSLLYVSYGRLLERQYRDDEAEAKYRQAISALPPDQYTVTRLANTFSSLTKYEYAVDAFARGAELLRDDRVFAYNLADLYRRMGDTPKMIDSYLNALAENPGRNAQVKTIFQRFLTDEEFRELQSQLYARIQADGDNQDYPELLAWVFIQRKDYKNALRQVKALDRRLDENGIRIYQLAAIAANDQDYDAAIEAFDYLVESKGPNSSFYIDAKRESLRARRAKLVDGYNFQVEDLRQLEQQYEAFLSEFGRSRLTASIILEYAELEALYLNDLDKAIALLSALIEYPGVDPSLQAEAKLQLADYYLMQNNIWEATLLYSQVDKAFKEDPLGHEARFRNARLSYFSGDFKWAQSQFDILKASTSKLIANDALDLSVFIIDNLGLDTTAAALNRYADAELLVFQNRFTEAFAKMDSLLAEFPEHDLNDDVLYLKARIYAKRRDYEKAAQIFQTIVEQYSDGIRADNSLFALAELYEKQLDDIEKAKTLYEQLFIDYSGSTFAVEARKRFRLLRGDKVQ